MNSHLNINQGYRFSGQQNITGHIYQGITGHIYQGSENILSIHPEINLDYETIDLNEVAEELKNLLVTLEKESDKPIILATKSLEKIASNPILKAKFISALKAGGREALEQVIDHPAIKIIILAAGQEWIETV